MYKHAHIFTQVGNISLNLISLKQSIPKRVYFKAHGDNKTSIYFYEKGGSRKDLLNGNSA